MKRHGVPSPIAKGKRVVVQFAPHAHGIFIAAEDQPSENARIAYFASADFRRVFFAETPEGLDGVAIVGYVVGPAPDAPAKNATRRAE